MHQFFSFILFCSSTLHVSDGLSVHHQESKTVHTASGVNQTESVWHIPESVHHQESKTLHTGSGIYQTDSADCLLAGTRWNCSSISFSLASSQLNLFDIHLMLYVQSQTPDDGRKDLRNM